MTPMSDDTALVRVRDLRIAFPGPQGTIDAVKGIDFDLPRGRITAVIGESGSGKSVTCLALLGLLENARVSGQMRFDDRLVAAGFRTDQLAPLRGRRIGMIFQDPVASLNPVRTIGSQLCETLRALTGERRGREIKARAIELLRTVRLPDPEVVFGRYPHQLSGGMNQRVMIALALAGAPDLLIADEPTTALDVTVQQEILQLLRQLRTETGLTILLVTHDIDVARDYADRLLVMRDGHLVEAGPTATVLAAPAHPYTRELVACTQSLEGTSDQPPIQEVCRA